MRKADDAGTPADLEAAALSSAHDARQDPASLGGVRPYTTGERASVAFSAVLGYGLDFYNILIVSFLMSAIRHALGISLVQAGVITTVTLAGSVVGGVLFGWLGDRIGRKTALMLTLGVFGGAAILSAFSWSFGSLLVLRAIEGIGLGGEWGVGMVLFNEVWSARRRGLGSGVVMVASGAGISAASAVAVWALGAFSAQWGWRIALLSGGTPVLLMVYVRFFMPESRLWEAYDGLRRRGELPVEKARASVSFIEIFKDESRRYTVAGLILVSGFMLSFYAVIVFMPELMKNLGAPLGAVRSATLLWGLTHSIGTLLGGWFSDHVGRRPGVLLPASVELLAVVGFYFFGADRFTGAITAWPLFWLYPLWGIGVGGTVAMFGCWLSELYPVELRSTAASIIYMAGRGVGSLGPYLVPLLASYLGGRVLDGIVIGGLVILLTIIAGLILPETAGRSFAVIETKARRI